MHPMAARPGINRHLIGPDGNTTHTRRDKPMPIRTILTLTALLMATGSTLAEETAQPDASGATVEAVEATELVVEARKPVTNTAVPSFTRILTSQRIA